MSKDWLRLAPYALSSLHDLCVAAGPLHHSSSCMVTLAHTTHHIQSHQFQVPYCPNVGLCLQTSVTVCAWDDMPLVLIPCSFSVDDSCGFYLLVDGFMMLLSFLELWFFKVKYLFPLDSVWHS